MIRKKKLILLLSVLVLIFSFRQADEYFEISKNLEIFSAVYKTVNSDYVDEVKPGDLMKKGIDAMLASLDPYTNYYTESQAEDAMIRQSGEYGGVGCQSVRIGNYTCIISITKGMPADKAGMMIGDKILEINGKSLEGKTMEDIGESLKGAPGTKATVTVERQGKPLKLEIVREEIKTRNVTYYGLIDAKTGYIRLDHFMHGAGSEVKEALIKMKASGISRLILDLRDNGGGLLHEAVRIVNVFVPSGQMVVISKGRSEDAYHEYKTLDPATDSEIPLVVLVNKNSASASEIVSGAIQDLDRGVVIGRNSFGKGLVQSIRPLVYRTQMKVTVAKYYIPSGRCIQLLDYGNKDEQGKAIAVADSLRKKFKTVNGREVLDGSGIRPDLNVELPSVPNIVTGLEKSWLIYDFANKYRAENATIPEIKSFAIDDQIFNAFKSFVSGKTFSHLSASEAEIVKLKEKLKEDGFYSSLSEDLNKLEAALNRSKMAELDTYKDEICKRLYIEICRRYYYEDAVFIGSFGKDPDLLKAIEVLDNKSVYNQTLGKK